jgi:hypothetical protein
VNFVENILPEKNLFNYGLDFEGTKVNNLINAKGKNPNNKISTNASFNFEEGFKWHRSMMMGHTSRALVLIKGDIAITNDPLDTNSGDVFTEEE